MPLSQCECVLVINKPSNPLVRLQEDLWRRLSHSCRKMVESAHLLLHHTCLQPILEGWGIPSSTTEIERKVNINTQDFFLLYRKENMQTFAEELLQHFTSFLPEKRWEWPVYKIKSWANFVDQTAFMYDFIKAGWFKSLTLFLTGSWQTIMSSSPSLMTSASCIRPFLSCILLSFLKIFFFYSCSKTYSTYRKKNAQHKYL